MAAVDAETLGKLGILRTRVGAIQALARACADGDLVLAPGAPVEATLEQLRALPGIGDWTAQYLALRALSWPDAFPAADYGVLKALGERSPAQARRRAEAWRPGGPTRCCICGNGWRISPLPRPPPMAPTDRPGDGDCRRLAPRPPPSSGN